MDGSSMLETRYKNQNTRESLMSLIAIEKERKQELLWEREKHAYQPRELTTALGKSTRRINLLTRELKTALIELGDNERYWG